MDITTPSGDAGKTTSNDETRPTTQLGTPPLGTPQQALKPVGFKTKATPRPVDVHVGARLRQRRTLLGFSQEKLGAGISLTFQQIQKYERGANRIGASRLYQLACLLDVNVSYFFEDMPGEVQKTRGDYAAPENSVKLEKVQTSDPMARRETLELVRAYYRIEDLKVRKRIFELTKSVAKAEAGPKLKPGRGDHGPL